MHQYAWTIHFLLSRNCGNIAVIFGYDQENFIGCKQGISRDRTQVTESQRKRAKKLLLNSLTGDEIFRYFLDVYNEVYEGNSGCLCPVEMIEIVLNEFVFQLLRLAVPCHRVSNCCHLWNGSWKAWLKLSSRSFRLIPGRNLSN
jgi:hypothetical protein